MDNVAVETGVAGRAVSNEVICVVVVDTDGLGMWSIDLVSNVLLIVKLGLDEVELWGLWPRWEREEWRGRIDEGEVDG
jgi:hypothetical protein